jgi:hypothetical protein
VALLAAALLARARARPVLGGLLLGLAICAAPLLVVVVPAVAVAAWRAGRPGPGLRFGLAAAVVWLGVRFLTLPGLSAGLGAAWQSWRSSPPGYGSVWLVPQLLSAARPREPAFLPARVIHGLFRWLFAADPMSGPTATALSLLTLAGLLAVLLRVLVSGPGSPPPAALALALLAAVMVTTTSLPVQASLLLLPLVALAGLRWRDHLIWAGTELVYFVGVWLYIAADSAPDRGLPASLYLLLLLARLAGIGWLGVRAALICAAVARVPPDDDGTGSWPGLDIALGPGSPPVSPSVSPPVSRDPGTRAILYPGRAGTPRSAGT